MDKIRVVLVDDHEDSLDILQYHIEQLPNYTIVHTCKNGEELIDAIMITNPDVVLLDINMPKLSGIEAIQTCLKLKSDLLFIFITSFDSFAVQAFELSAVDYIVKPIEKMRLYAALQKVSKAKLNSSPQDWEKVDQHQKLMIKEGQDFYYIPVNEILFIEKIGKKCFVYTSEKTYAIIETIGDLLKQLPDPEFFLSHRSYIVNLSKIEHISAKNQTYLAYFSHTNKYAHISKLKIDELQRRLENHF